MADKRIYITEVKEGDVCPFEEKCEGFYKLCEGCNVLPTRQESIERMAKAMCNSPFESCECCIVQKKKQACKQALDRMKELAEAALNSLLEDNK